MFYVVIKLILNYFLEEKLQQNGETALGANSYTTATKLRANSSSTLSSSLSSEQQQQLKQNGGGIMSNSSASLAATTQSTPEWLHFDDTKVEGMSNSEFHRKIIDSNFNSPYILFYVRC